MGDSAAESKLGSIVVMTFFSSLLMSDDSCYASIVFDLYLLFFCFLIERSDSSDVFSSLVRL